MQPADVGNAFYRQPLFTMVRVGALERRDHAKYGGLAVFGEAMVALGHAARNLKVDHAVAQAGAPEHIQNQFFPIDRGAARVDTDGPKAALQARQMLGHAKGLAVVDRHVFLHATAESKTEEIGNSKRREEGCKYE